MYIHLLKVKTLVRFAILPPRDSGEKLLFKHLCDIRKGFFPELLVYTLTEMWS